MPVILPREQTYQKVEHPQTMRGHLRHGEQMILVTEAVADWIRADLDDERYALYCNPRANRWDLVRLEHDGKYRLELSAPGTLTLGDAYYQLVRRQRETDSRRGFDVMASLDREEAARERADAREQSDFRQDYADHFLYRLIRKVFH